MIFWGDRNFSRGQNSVRINIFESIEISVAVEISVKLCFWDDQISGTFEVSVIQICFIFSSSSVSQKPLGADGTSKFVIIEQNLHHATSPEPMQVGRRCKTKLNKNLYYGGAILVKCFCWYGTKSETVNHFSSEVVECCIYFFLTQNCEKRKSKKSKI